MLAADVVPIRFDDRAHRHLADLRAAAHDDDALAVHLPERLREVDAHDAGHVLHLADDLIDGRLARELEIDLRFAMRLVDDVDVLDVRVVTREHLRHSEEHSGLVGESGQDCM